jgi:hypothetical protein
MEAHIGAIAFMLIMLGQCLAVIAVVSQHDNQERHSR